MLIGRKNLSEGERMPETNHILVAGGGIAGLSVALACAKHGYDITLVEQASEPGEVGAGLQIAANGTRVLHA